MSKNVFEKIIALFEKDATSSLEAYIVSHNPQNLAEVEKLTREFQDGNFVWARGL
jgi:hypothetical protein